MHEAQIWRALEAADSLIQNSRRIALETERSCASTSTFTRNLESKVEYGREARAFSKQYESGLSGRPYKLVAPKSLRTPHM
jgi:hypothetical protein